LRGFGTSISGVRIRPVNCTPGFGGGESAGR
jgi:hypothetical protein